jgi:hypothetical protein
MAPCNHPQVKPSIDTGNPDSVPAWRPRAHMKTRTGTLQDEEHFDLDDVSSSADDYKPPRSDHGCDVNPPAQEGNICIQINDSDTASSPKTAANDVHHFFNRSGDKTVCNICKQVL